MKPRRVIVTLEIETTAPLTAVRVLYGPPQRYRLSDNRGTWHNADVIQCQANAVRPRRPATAKAKRR